MTASGTTPWPSVVLVGGAAQDAAILQAGYGNGSYGAPRNRGKIFRNRIEFKKLYTELP